MRIIFAILFFCSCLALAQRSRRSRRLPPITQLAPVPLYECPNGILQRKEYRDMSQEEWASFRDALLSLQLSPSPDGGRYSEWDWFTRMHLDHVPEAHE